MKDFVFTWETSLGIFRHSVPIRAKNREAAIKAFRKVYPYMGKITCTECPKLTRIPQPKS
jgi:hypothetical protein